MHNSALYTMPKSRGPSKKKQVPIEFEITDVINGEIISRKHNINENRVLCYSVIDNKVCKYGNECIYAHNTDEQLVDNDREFHYKLILDPMMMGFNQMPACRKEEIYKALFFFTQLCEGCVAKKCTGGYNCKNGAINKFAKLCKNDLLTGECTNTTTELQIPQDMSKKLLDLTDVTATYCQNGQHISVKNMVPYYKYVHSNDESTKTQYQSVRYIDLSSATRFFLPNEHSMNNSSLSSPSSDSLELSYDDSVDDLLEN